MQLFLRLVLGLEKLLLHIRQGQYHALPMHRNNTYTSSLLSHTSPPLNPQTALGVEDRLILTQGQNPVLLSIKPFMESLCVGQLETGDPSEHYQQAARFLKSDTKTSKTQLSSFTA